MRPSIGAHGRVQASEQVHCRQFDDELLLLDLETGFYFSLNASGARMWAALISGKSPSDIVVDLGSDYEVSPEVLLADCIALADDLIERKLLRPRTP